MSGPSVVCLLPVRDGARDLDGYLVSAGRICDAIVALDDGSRDNTRERLQASPLVQVLLCNPIRRGYAGWDDGANRRRLLAAAGALEPEWIVSLDVDERIDATDAHALRQFLKIDALPGLAYGFQHYRMWGRRTYDPAGHWIYRLFAYSPDQRFPERKLHFTPIPTAIPRPRWMKTTIRVQHLGSANPRRLSQRRRKYAEADPEGAFGSDFGGLDHPPQHLRSWQRRPPDLPVLINSLLLAGRIGDGV